MKTVVDEIRYWASERPEHPALLIAHRGSAELERVTYAELLHAVDQRRGELRGSLGNRAARVGMVAPQGRSFIEVALAIVDSGGCFVPIPDDQSESALRDFATRAGLQALVRVRGDAEVDVFDGTPDHSEEFAALVPAYLRFTSGTTSERKGVVISHQRILERLNAANRGMEISPQDRVLWLLPMAHHFVVSILLYLSRGATIVLPDSSLAHSVLDVARRSEPTVFYASPYHYGLLAKDRSEQQLDSVRLAVSTADGLRAETAELFSDRYGRALVQALGIIEVGLPVMNLVSAGTKPTALGRALPEYEVWLRGEDGGAVTARGSAQDCGEICVRGPGMFDAYLEPWTPSQVVLEPDGFRTGDQGWLDQDGDLHLVGRRSNRINMAGMKFFSEEVEAEIGRHPLVACSRVIARDHPHLGQIPVAEVVLRPGAGDVKPRELTAFLKEHLASYKIPRQFRFVDQLPMTATGKVRRV